MSRKNQFHRRKQRREEAEARQQAHRSMTPEEKVNRARQRRGNSEQEIHRLMQPKTEKKAGKKK
jgi:hypothetical protein